MNEEREEQEKELAAMIEEQEKLMKEIEQTNAKQITLMAEFYSLKELLTPILDKTAIIPEEGKKTVEEEEMDNDDEKEDDKNGRSKKKDKEKKREKEREKDKGKSKRGKDKGKPLSGSNNGVVETSREIAPKELPLSDITRYVEDFLKVRLTFIYSCLSFLCQHQLVLRSVSSSSKKTYDIFPSSIVIISGKRRSSQSIRWCRID